MNAIKLLLVIPFFLSGKGWLTNLDDAKLEAQKEHRYILLNFSGSDWCVPCIKMHKEVLENDIFKKFADDNLVLVNADFPRLKKNRLPKEQQKLNDAMADQYNPKGYFPYTVLLDANGNVIRAWEGFYEQGADAFTLEVTNLISQKAN